MTRLRIVSPGPLTTVQDLGRPGYAALGISACGAADPLALRIGNRLVGNPEGAAALEMTLQGPTVQFLDPACVALAGAAEAARLVAGPEAAARRSVLPWTAVAVRAGEVLHCGALRHGARAYLCVAGGLRVPLVLGSASTHVRSGLGGLHGRALRADDELLAGPSAGAAPGARLAPTQRDRLYPQEQPRCLRVTDGPQGARFTPAALATFLSAVYEVSPRADRMGVRLSGPALRRADGPAAAGGAAADEPLTEGVYVGAVQVPADGQPILLSVDHQTTGGYPKIASIIAADQSRLGQLRPGDRVRFVRVSLDEADARWREQEGMLSSPDLIIA
jgi:biotin-dependent carboxylase-like uncharacterized protein